MASGSYAKKPAPQVSLEVQSKVPARATRHLDETNTENLALETDRATSRRTTGYKAPSYTTTTGIDTKAVGVKSSSKPLATYKQAGPVDFQSPHPLQRHKVWLIPLVICMAMAVVFLIVLISAGIYQRPYDPKLVNYSGGKVYDVQVGGTYANTWQSDQPIPPKVPLPIQSGPYNVLGKPTVTADFINKVLAAYHSPAAGKGQALYDLGVQYGIDPAFALAFFMHESSFGTAGEARSTLALGNLRCIPNRPCINTDGTACQQGQSCYAQFYSWEDGFKGWYELIRNLYVARWGLVTVDQIIPVYAPAADHNDEQGYINSLKRELDTWHSGMLTP